MRYAWTWPHELGRVPGPLRPAWPGIASLLRRSDRRRAANVDLFIATSKYVAGRIKSFYNRPALVVYPPVDTTFFTPDPSKPREDIFLCAGRLVAYKRADVAVQTATRLGVQLIVAGSGPELQRLRRLAGPTVEFVVQPSADELRTLYRLAKALVFPGIEDFGMVPVEAQACGTPVIALAEGGALEAVRDGVTGLLYEDRSSQGLAKALRSFDSHRFEPAVIRKQAERFGADRFDQQIRSIVQHVLSVPLERRPDAVHDLFEGRPVFEVNGEGSTPH